MNSFTAQVVRCIDSEIMAVRSRHAARLDAERARIVRERQAVADAAVVESREQRVLASRGRAIVRSLVEP